MYIWIGLPIFLTGTTDTRKKFHPYTLSICTRETGDDFEFVFKSLKDALLKLYQYNYKPTSLIADGADAITNGFMAAFGYKKVDDFVRVMCWPHVQRACEKQAPTTYRDDLMADIGILQTSYSHELFASNYQLFKDKWEAKKEKEIDTFLKYFDKEWVTSNNNGWF